MGLGIQDGSFKALDQKVQRRAKQNHEFQSWVQDQLALCSIIDSPDDPTKMLRQLGQQLTPKDLERILRVLNPQLKLIPVPGRPYASVCWGQHEHPVTKKLVPRRICGCENRLMPEFSLHERVIREIPFTGDRFTPDTPMFVKVPAPGAEIMRGWRTVLLRLMIEGAFTREACEALVGSADHRNWAAHVGKRWNLNPVIG